MDASHNCRRMACLLLAVAMAAGCGAARRRPPLAPPPVLNEEAQLGQVAFMEKCNRCHPGGEAGLGPALNDKPVPDFLKRFQVRHGVGVMPHFSEQELNDQQLDAILEYLEALRDNPGRPSRAGASQ
jgi:mono/diheme cytochrome c family protein